MINKKPFIIVVEENKIVATIADAVIKANVSNIFKVHTWNLICISARQDQK